LHFGRFSVRFRQESLVLVASSPAFFVQFLVQMGASKPPSTPASKVERTPMSTPTPGGSSRAPTPGSSSRPHTPGGSSRAKEEKIFVTVRVRPLSKKELAVRDDIAWECADSQTIMYKGPSQDRAAPASYTFGTISNNQFISNTSSIKLCLQLINVFVSLPDKIFGPACQTDVVYEEGAKDVAMSALTGINGTSIIIFAYWW
jgi:centromeric protein E